VAVIRLVLNPEQLQTCKNVVLHSQNAGFGMSAPIGIGVEILAGGDVSLNCRSRQPTGKLQRIEIRVKRCWQHLAPAPIFDE
jgi:hypothetical protein